MLPVESRWHALNRKKREVFRGVTAWVSVAEQGIGGASVSPAMDVK